MIINHFNKSFLHKKIFNINVLKLRGKNFHNKLVKKRNNIYNKLKKYILTNEFKMRCILCKNKLKKKDLYYAWKNYKLHTCNKCKATTPNIDFKKFNPSFYHSDQNKIKHVRSTVMQSLKYRSSLFGIERLNYIKEFTNLKKNSKLLDFGCGYGAFIDAVKKDKFFQACGLDFDQDSLNFCKSRNLDVIAYDHFLKSKEKYDIITFFDVVEHLDDPLNHLNLIANKLKKSGYFLFYTPNLNSLSSMIMGPEHNMFSPFDHLCFYQEESFQYLSKKLKMKIINIDYHGLDFKDFFLFYYKDKKTNNLNKELKKMNSFLNLSQAFLDKNKFSNSFRVFMQKYN